MYQTDEKLDALELYGKNGVIFYSYTYTFKDKNKEWIPLIRWDNLELQPHADIYDLNRNLIKQYITSPKTYRDVSKLIEIFRRNLTTMDLSKL